MGSVTGTLVGRGYTCRKWDKGAAYPEVRHARGTGAQGPWHGKVIEQNVDTNPRLGGESRTEGTGSEPPVLPGHSPGQSASNFGIDLECLSLKHLGPHSLARRFPGCLQLCVSLWGCERTLVGHLGGPPI